MNNNPTRKKIVVVADQLFYQQGFEYTSFSHIAEVVNISRGNFYYHFKTKDDILAAVMELRLENTRGMLNKWAIKLDDPIDRVRCFIHILIMNQAKIIQFGCPVGSLVTELAKLNHEAHHR